MIELLVFITAPIWLPIIAVIVAIHTYRKM